MPHKKIDFQVVHASAEDEKHPSSELNTNRHGPLVQGWTSQKFCLYPIDLIIQFDRKIVLKKVQLLSHQYLIASKIEFYIGDCADDNVSYETAKYTRLGYVELSSNERTDLKARELKSVHVDAEGTFIKFVIHKNFVNRLNLYNQVGLIAINIIGTDLNDDAKYPYSKNTETDPTVLAAVKRPDYISPLDDLAFAMYQDPEISQIIRNLDKKKTDCVLAEKYDEAKRLKQAISELYKIGERLARYDIEKRQAIEDEDYEKAKIKKQQMQEYRTETYRQLQQNNLLEFIEPDSRENLMRKANYASENESMLELRQTGHKLNENQKELESAARLRSYRAKSPSDVIMSKSSSVLATNRSSLRQSQQQQRSTTPQSNNSANEPDKPSTPYDDRVIPTLRHNNRSRLEKIDQPVAQIQLPAQINDEDESIQQQTDMNQSHEESQNNGTNDAIVPEQSNQEIIEQEMYDPMDGTEEMNEREVREAALMNDYLGKQVVTKLYSKSFQNREDAIQGVYSNLDNYKGDKEEAKSLMRATAILVAKMCKDNVFSVFNNSIKLFQFLLDDFAKRHAIGKQEINYVLEKALPVLLHRTGDSNARLRQRAQDYIVEMALFPEIKPLHTVPNYCTILIPLHIAPRLALSRVEIIEELMKRLGTRDNGLTVDNISRFCAKALEHTSGEVREIATKILIEMYKENGIVVRRYLPPDNEMNRRNKKYRILYDAFDSADGKPIQTYQFYDKNNDVSMTPRFNNRNVRTPNKSKTPNRGTSMDRKTPLSMADESEYNPDNTCMFCGDVNDKFLKQGFEMHYWKSCPMLKQCNDCKEVIEVSVQNEHLLTECQFKNNYKKCPRCSEAINTSNHQDHEFHFKAKQCAPNDKKGNRCPLCHTNIGSGEEIWKEHLMGPNGCTRNNRKTNFTTYSSNSTANEPTKKAAHHARNKQAAI